MPLHLHEQSFTLYEIRTRYPTLPEQVRKKQPTGAACPACYQLVLEISHGIVTFPPSA